MSHSDTIQPDTDQTSPEKSPEVAMVDPRAPRFGQLITTTLLVTGISLQEPLLVLAVAVILNTSVLSGWQVTIYASLWQAMLLPLVGKPDTTEPAAPHRFAKLIGAGMSALATLLIIGGPSIGVSVLSTAGYGVALVMAGAAATASLGDYCIGCKMYRQVAFFKRLGIV